ncbi:MAG TPA: DsbC family protein, partial [Burkholderiaceae bacterium]|nr:DsbC family protein [Burkholderiaceae bacterium]
MIASSSALPRTLAAFAAGALVASMAVADEAAIRKNLPERLPGFPKIDEVTKSPIAGLYEVRMGTEIVYTDEQGNHLIQGEIIDTRSRANLTEARVNKLTAIDPVNLPLKDAIVWKQGSGARKLVIFADPNCGYCKRFERDLQTVKDVTIYTFLIPILGSDSAGKARDIWCSKDAAAAWHKWMLNGTPPPRAKQQCDASAIERNLALSQKHKITGTPALIFEDGKRV